MGYANENFHPANETVAFVDAGTSEDAPPLNLDQNERPMAAGFDIGAYELQPPYDGENLVLTGVIAPDTYWAKVALQSPGMVNGAVIFKAGQSVSLLAGFEVQTGSQLEIVIQYFQLP